jgi:hypothetical protein
MAIWVASAMVSVSDELHRDVCVLVFSLLHPKEEE